jgi:hypothetical protein
MPVIVIIHADRVALLLFPGNFDKRLTGDDPVTPAFVADGLGQPVELLLRIERDSIISLDQRFQHQYR